LKIDWVAPVIVFERYMFIYRTVAMFKNSG